MPRIGLHIYVVFVYEPSPIINPVELQGIKVSLPGLAIGAALELALKKLSVDSLSNLYPHPFYTFIHYSHPPLLKRLSALNE